MRRRWGALLVALGLVPAVAVGQNGRPALEVGHLPSALDLDGRLDEPAWLTARAIPHLTMTEPVEGGDLVGATVVRVLVDNRTIVIGVTCHDPDPARIVSYSKARDSELRGEDHIKLILDTFLDGRSGYIFAVNPSGARYDALVANFGEGENSDWDAVWEARTARDADGWSAEIRIPVQSVSFAPGLSEWGFNIERRLERLQEVSRWASPVRDAKISQSSRAGRLTGLPDFDFGIGLTIRPAVVPGIEKQGMELEAETTLGPSLDVFQRLGANALASLTVNTDFAETEVDTRQTNLTRFPLFFPEKRTFFLEGADIFDFGIGLQTFRHPDIVPFFSRRIGLYEGEEIPLVVGGKTNGRVGQTNFGALVAHTGEQVVDVDDEIDTVTATTMGVARVKQNVLEQSSVGVIATVGDPLGRSGSWMTGVDATFQTSRLAGDKNFLVGVWGMVTDRADLTGDKTAFGGKIDYPNDTWDVALTYWRIGDGFDPSLGFVPRRSAQKWSAGLNYRHRPSWSWMRWMLFELRPSLVLDLGGRWESYRLFTAPVNWQLESGERVEFNVIPEGERLVEPFAIADTVTIAPGEYQWLRYRLEADIASKRPISGRVSWWFGGFYDGTLHQIQVSLLGKAWGFATLELGAERNIGRLSAGDFEQWLVSGRLRVNFSPDLQWHAYVQYDDESNSVGANTRLRWTYHPLGDLFVVYNHNLLEMDGNLRHESSQLLIKVQYALRL